MNAFRLKSTTATAALGVLLGFGFIGEISAQSVSTTPVGAMTYTFPATTQTTTTYISIPLTNPAVYTGPVASLTSNTITFSGTPFTAGALAQAGSPFFLRIASGPQAGRTMLVTANTANTVTVDTTDNSSQTTALDTSGWTLAAGNKVEVIVGDTLASLLGDNTAQNPLLFVGGDFISQADTISIYNSISGKFDVYFFHLTSNAWRKSGTVLSANNFVVYPETSLGILRRSGRSASALTIVGDVPVVSPLTKVASSSSAFTSTRFPVSVTLSNLNLANWVKADFVSSADTLSIYNVVSGKFDVYFQRLDGVWRKVGAGVTDYSSTTVSAGEAVGYLKRGSSAGSSSYISMPVPYSL